MAKICHVTSVHNTDDVRILKKECRSLAQNGDYVVFLVGKGKNGIYENVNIIGVGESPKNRIKRMTGFASKVVDEAIKVDADIYHLHDPELLRFALKLKRLGKKVIFDSHENVLDSIDDKVYMPFLVRKAFKVYYNRIQKKVLKRIDGIIVVTPQMIDTYKKYNSNIALITNYPIISDCEKEHNDSIVKGRFIFAGGISEQWSHKEIINVLDKIDGVEYYLFGIADEDYLDELKKLSGWRKVYYGGKVSFEVVQEELEKAQFVFALLKPSKNTFYKQGTLGNTKLFEAMENRKPVIATNFDLWKHIIEDNNCGICVDLDNMSSIEAAIRKLLEVSVEEYEKMGDNGRKTVIREFNWNNQAKKLSEFYEHIYML